MSDFPPCYGCGVAYDSIAFSDEEYRVLHCASCGLQHLNPTPISDHPENHHFSDLLYKEGIDREQERKQEVRSSIMAKEILKLEGRGRLPGKRLLDIGCGFGLFLQELVRHGYQVAGCEQNKPAVARAREAGLLVSENLHSPDILREGGYDVVTLWNVLEHIEDPIAFMQQCDSLLSDGGAVVVRVPNITLITFMWKLDKFRGRSTVYNDIPMHHFGFTFTSLQQVLSRAGFGGVHLIQSPMGDKAFSLEKLYGKAVAQLIVSAVETANWMTSKLTLGRFAGLSSTTVVAYRK